MVAEPTPIRRWFARGLPLATGAVFAVFIGVWLRDPLGVGFAALLACVILLPWAADDLDRPVVERGTRRVDYLLAILPLVLLVLIRGNGSAAIVVAVVAVSMLASIELLWAIRVPTRVAIALVIVQAMLFLSWPVWASSVLMRFDFGAWLQRVIDVSPDFAINAAIAPADPFTHIGQMYDWTNLGQDVPYAMPTSVWPCVGLHGAIAVVGLAAGSVRRRRFPSPSTQGEGQGEGPSD